MADFMTPLMEEVNDINKIVQAFAPKQPFEVVIKLVVDKGKVVPTFSGGFNAETNTTARWWPFLKEEFARRIEWSARLALAPVLPLGLLPRSDQDA